MNTMNEMRINVTHNICLPRVIGAVPWQENFHMLEIFCFVRKILLYMLILTTSSHNASQSFSSFCVPKIDIHVSTIV